MLCGLLLVVFKQKTAYEIGVRLVGSDRCIRDRCLGDAPTHCSHTPTVCKCLRDASKRCSHTPAVGKCLRDAPKRCSHTPAVGKCLRAQPIYSLEGPLATSGSLWSPLGCQTPLKTAKTPIFRPSALNSSAPCWRNPKPSKPFRRA